MGLRDLARKGLGLLVEIPPGQAAAEPLSGSGQGADVDLLRRKSIGDLLSELETADGSAPSKVEFKDAPQVVIQQDGQVDCEAIYTKAGIQKMTFTAEQTLELITSLPSELPLSTKRQMVAASLNTMGRAMNVSKEQVLLDAQQKLQALVAYEDAARAHRDAAVAAMLARVKDLEAEIDRERQKAAEAETQFQSVVQQCEAAGESLDEVQEFLTLDEGPSRMVEI